MSYYPFGDVVPGMDAAFPKEEFERHVASVQTEMAKRDLELLLLTGPENIFYLCGQQTAGYYMFQCLGVPVEGEPFFFLRGLEAANARANIYLDDIEIYADHADPTAELANVLKKRGWTGRRVAFDRSSWFLTVNQYEQLVAAAGEFLDGSGIVEPLRAVKSPLELEAIEKAAVAAEAGMKAGLEAVKPGATENDVMAAIVHAQYVNGCEYMGMEPFVCSGPRSGLRHGACRRRVIEDGETVTIENAACYNRYHAALYRSALAGDRADPEVRKIRDIVVDALERGLAQVKPGNTCADVHNAVADTVADCGYEENYRKRAGYSIGIAFGPDWGEGHILSLNHDVHVELVPGMVFHMPTSICHYGRHSLCCSETFIVTEDGHRTLSSLPRRAF